MKSIEAIKAVNAVTMYWHWTEPCVLWNKLFPNSNKDYHDKWTKRYHSQGFSNCWGQLSDDKKLLLVENAIKEHGEEQDRRFMVS